MPDAQEFIQEARKFFFARRTKFRTKPIIGVDVSYWGSWEKLGNGFYGEAWEHEDYPGLVIKISGPSGWGFDYEDCPGMNRDSSTDEPRPDVWPAFAEHCMNNPHENLPRVLHLERVGGMAWGVMPKYESHPDLYDDDVFNRFREAMHGRRAASHWMLPLVHIAHKAHVAVDLHAGNVMVDPDSGETIILDPFSSTGFRAYDEEPRLTDLTHYLCDEYPTYDSTTEGEYRATE